MDRNPRTASATPAKPRSIQPLVWILLVCLAPIVFAILAYYVPALGLRPDEASNYGQLLDPQRPIPAAEALGLKTEDDTPLDLDKIPRPAQVFDMIYRPPQTALLRQATELRIPNANGLSMLIHQGAASLQLWTGETPPVAVMQHAARNALASSR